MNQDDTRKRIEGLRFTQDHYDRLADACQCQPEIGDWACLVADAQFYLDPYGPDAGPGLRASARAVMRMLSRVH